MKAQEKWRRNVEAQTEKRKRKQCEKAEYRAKLLETMKKEGMEDTQGLSLIHI